MKRTARAARAARAFRTIAGALLAATLACSGPALADERIAVLFVGNSYTFGRVDPVMSYNAANVQDLTAAFYAASPTGANPWEPHPWGGVPGIFKQLTVEAGLNYDVSISARNAASLRGQFLNTANAAWDLRGNDAFQRAYDLGIVKTEDFYTASGVYAPPRHGDRMDLWWKDYLHASKYGSYLDALVQFGTITGLDPRLFGPMETAARDLGIAVNDALMLQWVASAELGFAGALPGRRPGR